MTPLAKKLTDMLREAGADLPAIEWKVRRLMPSRNQRDAGAWLWTLYPVNSSDLKLASFGLRIGSFYTATHCVKSGIEIDQTRSGDIEVFPLREGQSTHTF